MLTLLRIEFARLTRIKPSLKISLLLTAVSANATREWKVRLYSFCLT